MNMKKINNCPGTLKKGLSTYGTTCLRRLFNAKKVHHILPYSSPTSTIESEQLFDESRKRISISGVQEKFSMLLEKNKLRLIEGTERGMYILKPIPSFGSKREEMPANEHLTMQIARQVYDIETAENALIFFQNGEPAYITKRFDVKDDGEKWAKEDFASLAERTPQTHGENYKYEGSYLEIFELLKKFVPAYKIEAPKLFKLILFNYLFSNGDAHFKNFALIETEQGDFRLSPAYDLLNSRIHINDSDFALKKGLLNKTLAKGTISKQLLLLAKHAEISEKKAKKIMQNMMANTEKVDELISASFLKESTKRNYLQAYQTRLKKLKKDFDV